MTPCIRPNRRLLATALVRLLLVGRFRIAEGEALEVGLLPSPFEGLAGYDAVDLWDRGSIPSSQSVGRCKYQ